MLLLWFVLILTVKKRWFVMCNRNLHDCIHVSIPAPFHFNIFATGKRTNHGGEYVNNFYGPEKVIKLAKK